MMLDEVLLELIQNLESNKNTLTWEQFREWPKDAVQIFQDAGWIKPAAPYKTVVCPGCEENCFMPVHSYPSKPDQPERHFVNCDVRNDMGRIPIPSEMLQQWQVTEYQVARWLVRELGIRGKPKINRESGSIEIGHIQGENKTSLLKWIKGSSIILQASGHSLPLIQAVNFKDNQLKIDQDSLAKMVDRPPQKDRYQPSVARREARKLETQEKYKIWQREYRRLKRDHPEWSDTGCATEISESAIGMGKSPETIRKNMK